MTHEITTSKGKFLFVGVPEGTKISKGYARELKPYILKFKDNDVVLFQEYFNKTIGNGEIVSLLSTITEDRAREIVDSAFNKYFFDYTRPKEGNYMPGYLFDNGIESLHSLMRAERLYVVNPYFHLGSEKPIGEVEVSYDEGKTFDDSVGWREKRTCMMAGISGGHGYFDEGWATTGSNGTDTGLICDNPDYWVKVNEFELYEQSQPRTFPDWLIIKVK